MWRPFAGPLPVLDESSRRGPTPSCRCSANTTIVSRPSRSPFRSSRHDKNAQIVYRIFLPGFVRSFFVFRLYIFLLPCRCRRNRSRSDFRNSARVSRIAFSRVSVICDAKFSSDCCPVITSKVEDTLNTVSTNCDHFKTIILYVRSCCTQ